MHFPIFTNNIWSYLLWSPVVAAVYLPSSFSLRYYDMSLGAWVMTRWRASFACFALSEASPPGVGHGWRKQNGDGRQGSKVPGRPVGRTWLRHSYHKLTAEATWEVLFVFFVVLRFAYYFPRFLVILCLYVVAGSGSVFLARLVLSATSPTGGNDNFSFFSFSLSHRLQQ